jgi:Cu/Ag efflux protein CusF
MKKIFVLALAFLIVTSIVAVAQDTMGNSTTTTSAASDKMPKAPLKSIKGTVKQDGDKITFVSDKDSKSWDVMNPETLKDHVGHHVKLSAHVYADKGAIHVMNVKMIKKSAM